jgi:hypothetical protein
MANNLTSQKLMYIKLEEKLNELRRLCHMKINDRDTYHIHAHANHQEIAEMNERLAYSAQQKEKEIEAKLVTF